MSDASLLRDAIEFISKQAVEAAGPKILEIPGDGRSVAFADKQGFPLLHPVPPPCRNHTIFDITDFIAAVNFWSDPEKGVVFHNDHEIAALLDHTDRRDIVTMPLRYSEIFDFLQKIPRSVLDHKKFIRVLKHDMAGCVPEGLLPRIRKIEVASGGRQSADVQHGKDRGTREFMAELANAADIPEIVPVTTSVYANPGLRAAQTIRCSLDVDVHAMTFQFGALPDEINAAIESAQALIHERLLNEVAPRQVFQGSR